MKDLMNGIPWWVKSIATVGFPIAVSAFLLGQSAGWVPSQAQALTEQLRHRTEAFDRHIKSTEDLTIVVKQVARIMCENSAMTDTQRRNCEVLR